MLPDRAVTSLVHNTQRFQIETGVLKLEIIATITRNLLKSSKIYSRVTYGKRCKEDDSRGTEVQTKNCHPKTQKHCWRRNIMRIFTYWIRDFLRDEEGLTTVEYAIAGALVGLAVVVAFTDLGIAVGTVIGDLEDAVTPAT